MIANIVITFFVENDVERGKANYCRVNKYASRTEFEACAANRFDINSTACSNVYPPADETTAPSTATYIDVSDRFKTVLVAIFLLAFAGAHQGGGCLCALVLFIFMNVYRYSETGRFCSGAFNPDSVDFAP